jgi:four helix bundle protein
MVNWIIAEEVVKYGLEERTFQFAKHVCIYTKKIKKSLENNEYIKQLIRSSGSTGSNYIEANEALSKKDFIMRLKISRKESKESAYWLRLLIETNADNIEEGKKLMNEAQELKKIFSAIIIKCQ